MRSIHHVTRLVVLTSLAAAAILLALSCRRAAEPLRWKLQAGDKFDYVTIMDMAMAMAGGPVGQQINTSMHQQMDMTWDVENIDADGNAVVGQSINRVRMTMNAPMGQGFQYDSQAKEPPTGMAAKIAPMYEAMLQDKVEITVTPRGKIVNVKIPEKMSEELKDMPGAAGMGDIASAEGFQKMFMQGSMVLPEDSPTPGQTWTSNMEMNNPMMGKMTVDTAYEYQGTKEVDGTTCAVIAPTVTTKFEGEATIPMTIKNQTSSGEILFDLDQGRLRSSLVKQGMTIDIAMGDQSIQQTMDQTINVTLTPVKE